MSPQAIRLKRFRDMTWDRQRNMTLERQRNTTLERQRSMTSTDLQGCSDEAMDLPGDQGAAPH